MKHDEFSELLYEALNNRGLEIGDPDIHVVGMGIMRLSFIKYHIREHIKGILNAFDDDRWDLMYLLLYGNGTMKAYIEAIVKYEEDLKKRAN